MTSPVDVLFRFSGGEVTAVFPSECGTNPHDMMCYAHIGQHSACSLRWYRTTRRATPEQYKDLLAELTRVYAPEYHLVVRQRITRKHFEPREAQMRGVA